MAFVSQKTTCWLKTPWKIANRRRLPIWIALTEPQLCLGEAWTATGESAGQSLVITVLSACTLTRRFCAKARMSRSGNGPFRTFVKSQQEKARTSANKPCFNCVDKPLMYPPRPNDGAHNCFTGSPHANFKFLHWHSPLFCARGISRRNSSRHHTQL